MKETYVLERYKNEWAAFSLKVNTYDYFSKNKNDVIKWITEKNKKIIQERRNEKMNKLFKVSTWPGRGHTMFTNWVGATNEQEAIEKTLVNAINEKSDKVYYRKIEEINPNDYSINDLADLIINDDALKDALFEVYDEAAYNVKNDEIDRQLIYTSDFWDVLKEHTTPADLLNGKYTWDDLINDMWEDIEPFEHVALIIEYVGKKEVLEGLADFLESEGV